MSTKTYTNPWAGLSSYQDPESADVQLKFCGRDNESFDVAQLIDDNIFVTLYGKSGTGKTSLLNAGVFPRLRQEQYLPVSIRLGMEAFDISFQQCVLTKISQALQGKGTQTTVEVVPMPADEQSTEYLWSYFARTRFMAADGRTLFPVLVFDQFEEVFRNRRDEAETLLRQIHFMMDENHALSDRLVDGQPYQYDFNFRFVASIREDDLYRLEDSIDNCYLPELKRCRYRLRSLSEQGASDVILIPGEGLFKSEEQKDIVDKIVGKSLNEDGSISTNIISLLCSRIYADFQRSGANYISPALVDSFLKGNPFEQFYNEATRGFSNREKSYIEDHLVDSTGRRNSVPEGDFLRYVKNGAVLMEGSLRILQRTNTSSDSNNYRVELIHDSFCEPMAVLNRKREQRRRFLWLVLGTSIVLTCVAIIFYFIYLVKQNERKDITITTTQQERDLADKQRHDIELLYDSIISLNASLQQQLVIITHQKDSIITQQKEKEKIIESFTERIYDFRFNTGRFDISLEDPVNVAIINNLKTELSKPNKVVTYFEVLCGISPDGNVTTNELLGSKRAYSIKKLLQPYLKDIKIVIKVKVHTWNDVANILALSGYIELSDSIKSIKGSDIEKYRIIRSFPSYDDVIVPAIEKCRYIKCSYKSYDK